MGVGLPGSLDPRTRIAKGASSTWLNGRAVEDDLRRVLGRDVRTSNDADCFAVSEATDGAGAGHRVVFGVILGTGAGAGIAVDGRAHHGPNHSAGEWGHNVLPLPDVTEIPGPACYCGKHGCLERWVSGRAFAQDYLRHAQVDLAEPATVTAREVMAASAPGTGSPGWSGTATSTGWPAGWPWWSTPSTRMCWSSAAACPTSPSSTLSSRNGWPRTIFSPCFYTPILPAAHGDSSGVRGAAWLWKD